MYRNKSVVACLTFTSLLAASLCTAQEQQGAMNREPRINNVRFIPPAPTPSFKDKENKVASVKFELALEGENLPEDPKTVNQVSFEGKDPATRVTTLKIACPNSRELRVEASAEVEVNKVDIDKVEFNFDLLKVIISEKPVEMNPWAISIKSSAPPEIAEKLKQFEIKFIHEKNKEFPNLHSLVVTKEGGDGGFANNPHRMSVDLTPVGATDLNVVQTSSQQLDLHFVAAEDYEPKGVVVTVFDSSDLDTRAPIAVSIDKKSTDTAQPTISGTEIVFINRHQGTGRIRIYGKGFGDYSEPPYPVDEYLWNCLERPHQMSRTVESPELDELAALREENVRALACASLQTDQKAFTLEPVEIKRGLNKKQRDEVNDKLRKEASTLAGPKKTTRDKWNTWQKEIENRVNVGVRSHNADIRVEKVEILNINDKMIDAYFEFTRYDGYALPFRLADSHVTIKKILPSTDTLKNDKVTVTVKGSKEETYTIAYQPGAKPDPNLSYKYTVFDKKSANTLLGKGIADNFFVLQLSVVNNGEKKVTIPLSAIQAEVEWVFGTDYKSTLYLQGPATVSPFPLAAVSGYFDAYQKVRGTRAIVFNTLNAATIMTTALVPFAGPSVKDAAVYFSGGFVPGLGKAWGDLSGQQLQNLTALSWESSETLPAKGGSTEKLIYIPENDEVVGRKIEVSGQKNDIKKRIANIMDVELTGYEVVESEPKQATATATTGATKSSSPPSSSPSGTTSPKPTEPKSTSNK